MDKIRSVRRSGLTFAPEAGTQRLRDVINKNVYEDELMRTVSTAFAGGWNSVKLYFMLGLPTETMEDVAGIAELGQKVVDPVLYQPGTEKGEGRFCHAECFRLCAQGVHPPSSGNHRTPLRTLHEKQQHLVQSVKTKKDYLPLP